MQSEVEKKVEKLEQEVERLRHDIVNISVILKNMVEKNGIL